MLDLVRSILETFGTGRVITAQNGEEAFQKYLDYNPDLIIADWMMKPMDGISLTRKIRQSEHSPNRFVPVLLMTGFSEKRRVEEARDAGVTEFLGKPFNTRDLYSRLAQIIENPRKFVRTESFFGPDRRRRKKEKTYAGPMRRESDRAQSSGPKNILKDAFFVDVDN